MVRVRVRALRLGLALTARYGVELAFMLMNPISPISPYISLYLPISPCRYGVELAFMLMNSFSTSADTLKVRARARVSVRVRVRVRLRLRVRARARVRLGLGLGLRLRLRVRGASPPGS